MKSVNKTKIALAFLFSIFKFFVGQILQGILSESTNFHLHVFLASDMRDCNYVSKVFLNCRNADIFGLNSQPYKNKCTITRCDKNKNSLDRLIYSPHQWPGNQFQNGLDFSHSYGFLLPPLHDDDQLKNCCAVYDQIHSLRGRALLLSRNGMSILLI